MKNEQSDEPIIPEHGGRPGLARITQTIRIMASKPQSRPWLTLPIWPTLRSYRRADLMPDFVSGASVCVVLIPSVVAYSELVGVTPVQGLYAALIGMFVYALFASSRRVIVGPDAAICLLAGSVVIPLSGGDPARAAALAAALAAIAGLIVLLAACLKAGVVADLLSKPVLVGYLSGAALVLIGTQAGKLFGISLKHSDFFPRIAELLARLGETHLPTLGLGAFFVVLLWAIGRYARGIPGSLVIFILALVLSYAFRLHERGFAIVGDIPSGLPSFDFPVITSDDKDKIFPAALGIAFLTIPEGILLGRAFAARHREEIRPNQELVSLGVANVVAGLFQGFSVGASQSRTTLNDSTGGRTQMVSLIASALLCLFLLFLTPVLSYLPLVALAAILVYAGIGLIEIKELRVLVRIHPHSFFISLTTGVCVLILGVVPGILVGVLISLIGLLRRLSRPQDAVLREVPATGHYHDLGESEDPQALPGLIAYRYYAPLFFSNAGHFVGRIRELIDRSPRHVDWVLLDAQAITDIDVTAAEAIVHLIGELQVQGTVLKVARANRPLRETLERIGLKEHLGGGNFFASVHEGAAAYLREHPSIHEALLPEEPPDI